MSNQIFMANHATSDIQWSWSSKICLTGVFWLTIELVHSIQCLFIDIATFGESCRLLVDSNQWIPLHRSTFISVAMLRWAPSGDQLNLPNFFSSRTLFIVIYASKIFFESRGRAMLCNPGNDYLDNTIELIVPLERHWKEWHCELRRIPQHNS